MITSTAVTHPSLVAHWTRIADSSGRVHLELRWVPPADAITAGSLKSAA